MKVSTKQTTIEYLLDDRARWLGKAVDDAYWKFVNELPKELQGIASLRGTFDHRSGNARIEGLLERNAINTGSLFLFWELCDGIADPTLLILAESSAFVGLAYILLDHLVDDQTVDPTGFTLLQLAFHERGFRKLQLLFSSDHPFWVEYDRLSARLRSSLALEVACREDPRKYSEGSFLLSTHGKVSPAAISLTALSMLQPAFDDLSTIEKALLDTIIAGQLAHDIEEWRNDLSEGDLTYFLSTCAAVDRWLDAKWPSEKEIEDNIFGSRNDAKYVAKAGEWFVRAKESSDRLRSVDGKKYEFLNWNAYIGHYIAQANRFADRATRRHIRRAVFG